MKTQVTAKTVRIEYSQMTPLLRAALGMIEDVADPEGPIDALVPWYAASLFVKAVSQATGEVADCDYVRPGMGHITSPGRRAALDAQIAMEAVKMAAKFPYVWSDGTRNAHPEWPYSEKSD